MIKLVIQKADGIEDDETEDDETKDDDGEDNERWEKPFAEESLAALLMG